MILIEIYRDEKTTLAEQLVWMRVLLDRTTIIKRVKKEQIKERLKMFEQLFDQSPFIQKIREQSLVKGRQEGLQEGLQKGRHDGIQALQDLLVSSVQARYPD